MYFDGGGENLLAERGRTLFIGQRFQKQLNRFTDIGKAFLDGLSLRLASPQFRAPSVISVLVLFDYDTDLARHRSHSIVSGRRQLKQSSFPSLESVPDPSMPDNSPSPRPPAAPAVPAPHRSASW